MDRNEKLVCNMCGKRLLRENDIPLEDYVVVRKEWGYFSKKDGITQKFALCETCCDTLVNSFKVPADVRKTTELL